MKIIGTIASVMLFAIKSFSMELPDLLFATLTYLSWSETAAIAPTCRLFNNVKNERNQLNAAEIANLNIPNGSKFVCFGSEKSLCMIYEDIARTHLALRTINGQVLQESVIPLDFDLDEYFAPHRQGIRSASQDLPKRLIPPGLDLRDEHFASHERGILFNHKNSVGILDEKEGSLTVFMGYVSGLNKISSIGDNIVHQCDDYVYVKNIKDQKSMTIFGSPNIITGLEKHIWCFGNETVEVHNIQCNSYTKIHDKKIVQLPIKIAVSNNKLMITCHEDMELSTLTFFKTFYFREPINSSEPSSCIETEEMKLSLPIEFPIQQLFLKGHLLFVRAKSNYTWSLLVFDINKDQILHQQNFELPISQFYLAGEHIFGVIEARDIKSEDLVSIIAIDIGRLLN